MWLDQEPPEGGVGGEGLCGDAGPGSTVWGGPAARGEGWVETLTLLLEEPPAMTSTSPVWAGWASTVGLGARQALVGPPEPGEDLVARSDGVFWPQQPS